MGTSCDSDVYVDLVASVASGNARRVEQTGPYILQGDLGTTSPCGPGT